MPLTLVVHAANHGYSSANNSGRGNRPCPPPAVPQLRRDPRPVRLAAALCAELKHRPQPAPSAPSCCSKTTRCSTPVCTSAATTGRWINQHYHKGMPRDFAPACRPRAVPKSRALRADAGCLVPRDRRLHPGLHHRRLRGTPTSASRSGLPDAKSVTSPPPSSTTWSASRSAATPATCAASPPNTTHGSTRPLVRPDGGPDEPRLDSQRAFLSRLPDRRNRAERRRQRHEHAPADFLRPARQSAVIKLWSARMCATPSGSTGCAEHRAEPLPAGAALGKHLRRRRRFPRDRRRVPPPFRPARRPAPDHKVLEIGCGIGRMAVPLTQYLSTGTYDGIDVVADGINWCATSRPPTRPSASITSTSQRPVQPAGPDRARAVALPFADQSFDFVLLTSVLPICQAAETLAYAGRSPPAGRAVAASSACS